MTASQVAADLRAAAEVLRRDGWTQGTVGAEDGPKCALGAIHYVAANGNGCGDDELDEAEMKRAYAAVRVVEARLTGVESLAEWNDGARTADEVIAALEAAADAAEADQ